MRARLAIGALAGALLALGAPAAAGAAQHNTLDGQSGTLTLDGFVRY